MRRLPLFALLFAACEDPPRVIEEGPVTLTLLHAAPGAGPVEVTVDGAVAGSLDYLGQQPDVAATNVSTVIASGETGQTTLTLGGRPDDAMMAVVLADASGALTSTSLSLDFATDDPAARLVRFVHGSPDLGPVAIDVDGDGQADTSLLSFRESSGPRGIALPTGIPILTVLDASGSPVAGFRLAEPVDGSTEVLVLTGLSSAVDPSDSLTVVGGTAGAISSARPALYVVHALPNAGAVDVYRDEVLVIDGLTYGTLAAPVFTPTGPQTLDLFPDTASTARPSDPPLASLTTPHITASERHLAVFAGEGPVLALSDNDAGTLSAVHAAAGVPEVSVGTLRGVAFDALAVPVDLTYGERSDTPAPLPVGDVALGVMGDDGILDAGTLSATATSRWTGVAVSGTTDLELWVVDQSTAAWSLSRLIPDPDDTEPDTDADTELDTEADTEADTEPDTEADTEADTDADTTPIPDGR